MNVINKFDVHESVIPNGLEKYMAFTINKNLVFIDSEQFMNSSIEKLGKSLLENYFKYLSEEFNPEQLKLVKKKECILMNKWTVLQDFIKTNYVINNTFIGL